MKQRQKRYSQYMYSYPHKTAYGPLDGISLEDYKDQLAGGGHSLYLHIPFCESKCGYCNLFSVTGRTPLQMDGYLDAVERQIGQYQEILDTAGTEFCDFTIGGGTPLGLSEAQLERMFSMVDRNFRFSETPDLVIETAPNQTTKEKLAILKAAGVTRVSMGIQSFWDTELRTLKRRHGAGQARKALLLLKAAKFSCINVDLIYGVPGQTEETFLESVKQTAGYEPEELFLYPLYVKHGVALEREKSLFLDEELAYRQYCQAAWYLKDHGYRQDSMRRFVRAESQNREFCECGFGTTLSLGCGGRSYIGSLHFCTPYSVSQPECLLQLERFLTTQDYLRITHGFFLSEEEVKRRYVIKHLLMVPGIKKASYRERFKTEVQKEFPVLNLWTENGYVKDSDGYLSLTEEGLGLSDYLGPALISDEVRSKMKQWEVAHGLSCGSVQREFEKL